MKKRLFSVCLVVSFNALGMNFLDLPNEMQQGIFSELGNLQLIGRNATVCKSWSKNIESILKNTDEMGSLIVKNDNNICPALISIARAGKEDLFNKVWDKQSKDQKNQRVSVQNDQKCFCSSKKDGCKSIFAVYAGRCFTYEHGIAKAMLDGEFDQVRIRVANKNRDGTSSWYRECRPVLASAIKSGDLEMVKVIEKSITYVDYFGHYFELTFMGIVQLYILTPGVALGAFFVAAGGVILVNGAKDLVGGVLRH